nr:hypothetical protein [uncultured Pseudoxanthomonas sp.]
MEFEAIIPLVNATTAVFGIPHAWRQAPHFQGFRWNSDFNFEARRSGEPPSAGICKAIESNPSIHAWEGTLAV